MFSFCLQILCSHDGKLSVFKNYEHMDSSPFLMQVLWDTVEQKRMVVRLIMWSTNTIWYGSKRESSFVNFLCQTFPELIFSFFFFFQLCAMVRKEPYVCTESWVVIRIKVSVILISWIWSLSRNRRKHIHNSWWK